VSYHTPHRSELTYISRSCINNPRYKSYVKNQPSIPDPSLRDQDVIILSLLSHSCILKQDYPLSKIPLKTSQFKPLVIWVGIDGYRKESSILHLWIILSSWILSGDAVSVFRVVQYQNSLCWQCLVKSSAIGALSYFSPLSSISGLLVLVSRVHPAHPGLPGVLHHSNKLQTLPQDTLLREHVEMSWHDDVTYTIV
jgi:hypothetical protein